MRITHLFSPCIIIVALMACTGYSQNNPNNMLKNVDALVNDGLYKQAITQLNTVISESRNQEDAATEVIAIWRRADLVRRSDERRDLAAIEQLYADTQEESTEEVKSMVYLALASHLRTRSQAYRYQLEHRTYSPDIRKLPVDQWDLQTLEEASRDALTAFLGRSDALREVPLGDYIGLIKSGENMTHLYPTLYDLAMHHALGVLNARGEVKDIDLWPVEDWIEQVEAPGAGESWTDERLYDVLYKYLIEAQLTYEDHDPLVYSLYTRLSQWSGRNWASAKQVDAYENLLEGYADRFKATDEVACIDYLLGTHRLATLQGVTSLEDRIANAPGISDVVSRWAASIASHPKAYGTSLIKGAQQGLIQPDASLVTEGFVAPGETILVKVDHKRVKSATIGLTKLTRDAAYAYLRRRGNEANLIDGLIDRHGYVVQHEITPARSDDYTSYSSEHMLEGQPAGIYLITLRAGDRLEAGATALVMVSDMVAVYHEVNGGQQLVVMDRTTGQPMPDVRAAVYLMNRHDRRPGEPFSSAITDEDGAAQVSLPRRYGRTMLELQHDGQLLILSDHLYPQGAGGRQQGHDQVQLHTDRAIYRPGQTIHFSGIVYHRVGHQYPTLSELKKVTVRLRDMNYQEVETLELMVDEYGGVHGSFKLPAAGLNGQYTIEVDQLGSQGVRVEAYKRPTFKVEMNPIEGDIAFDEPLTIAGSATTYAGPMVQGGQVSYRIYRYFHRPYWCGVYYDFYLPPWLTDETLVASGETRTDDDGNIGIPFVPASVTDGRHTTVVSYRVEVDVLDEKGETQSTKYTFSVSNVTQYLTTNLAPIMSAEDFDSLELSVHNIMQQPTSKSLTWELQLLKRPERLLKNRLWPVADFPVADSVSFAEALPMYHRDRTLDFDSWEVAELWSLATGKVRGARTWKLPSLPSAGVYRLSVYDDRDSLIRTEHTTVYSIDEMVLPTSEVLSTVVAKDAYEPGETARVLLGQRYEGTPVRVQIMRQSGAESPYWVTPVDDARYIDIPITSEDYGGVRVALTSVRYGRISTITAHVNVPRKHKELDVRLVTMRDETLPGSKESWTVRIQDWNGQPLEARLLAAMYDQSLEAFVPHNWHRPDAHQWYPLLSSRLMAWGTTWLHLNWPFASHGQTYRPPYFKYVGGGAAFAYRGARGGRISDDSMLEMAADMPMAKSAAPGLEDQGLSNQTSIIGTPPAGGGDDGANHTPPASFSPRVNLAETVFFYPTLESDQDGEVKLEFTMNEALTTWRLYLMAWSKSLAIGQTSHDIVTKKDLMVFPQLPRFMREGDALTLTARVNKLVDEPLDMTASIELIDVFTGDTVTSDWLSSPLQHLDHVTEAATQVEWQVKVPRGATRPVKVIITAWSGDHVDGEVHEVPIISSKKLITETLPMYAHGGQHKAYTFDPLSTFDQQGRQPIGLTVEYMDNPAWLAVQSLPYLAGYNHHCTEQIAHRIFANALSTHILDQLPQLEGMIKQWQVDGQLTSPLSDNQELKHILLEYTPWLRDALDEESGMAAIAELFDRTRTKNALTTDVSKLIHRQQGDGGFTWYGGHRSDRYTTQLILEIFGRLQTLGVAVPGGAELHAAMQRALDFVHGEIIEEYRRSKIDDYGVSNRDLHALYVYSMYDVTEPWSSEAWQQIVTKGRDGWLERSLYTQAMMVVGYHRLDTEDAFPTKVLASLRDRAHESEELGLHWIYHKGYAWHQRPIEAQSMMIEAFYEMGAQREVIDAMRLWLLKHKQTNRWESTVATGRAVYALLIQGSDWLSETRPVKVQMAGTPVDFGESVPGTGYRQTRIDGEDISTSMAAITIDNPNEVTSWGAAYYQYLQDADQVKAHETEGMSLRRELMLKRTSGEQMSLTSLEDIDLAVGDRVTVRLTFTVDRLMSYLHIEDMRPSGVSPVEQLSRYEWRDGIGYYQTASDVATHYFIDHAYPGTYVLEYDTWVNLEGDYSAGLATVQCMYAPEFAAQSEGSRLLVGAK